MAPPSLGFAPQAQFYHGEHGARDTGEAGKGKLHIPRLLKIALNNQILFVHSEREAVSNRATKRKS